MSIWNGRIAVSEGWVVVIAAVPFLVFLCGWRTRELYDNMLS
jgi:hypothetical protein